MRAAAVTPTGDPMRWLAGRRALPVDLLEHGISDRPTDFDYSLESHAAPWRSCRPPGTPSRSRASC